MPASPASGPVRWTPVRLVVDAVLIDAVLVDVGRTEKQS